MEENTINEEKLREYILNIFSKYAQLYERETGLEDYTTTDLIEYISDEELLKDSFRYLGWSDEEKIAAIKKIHDQDFIKNIIDHTTRMSSVGKLLGVAAMQLEKEDFVKYMCSNDRGFFWQRVCCHSYREELSEEATYVLDEMQDKFGVEAFKEIVEHEITADEGDDFSKIDPYLIEEMLLRILKVEKETDKEGKKASDYLVSIMKKMRKIESEVPSSTRGFKDFEANERVEFFRGIDINKLIFAADDIELIKKILDGDEELYEQLTGEERSQKRKGVVRLPGKHNYLELLVSLEDADYIKKILEENSNYFSSTRVVEIIAKKSPELIKKCIETKVVDDPEALKMLVIATKDPEYLIESQKKGIIDISEEEILALQIASKGLDAKKIADTVNRYNGLNIGLTVYTDLDPKLVREAGNRLGRDREQVLENDKKTVEQPRD